MKRSMIFFLGLVLFGPLFVSTAFSSKAYGAAADTTVASRADATVIVLKDTGHWVLEENPKETTEALEKLL